MSSSSYSSIVEKLAPTWNRAMDFVLERAWIEYLALMLLFIIPFKQGETVTSRTVFIGITTAVLLGAKYLIAPYVTASQSNAYATAAEQLEKMQQLERMKTQTK